MSRYGGSCEETMLTVFKKLGEDASGAAQYTALHYEGIVEQHESGDMSNAVRDTEHWMTGFLFPSVRADGSGRPLPVSLVPGRDLLACGVFDGAPGEAMLSGAAVYTVLDTARPAHFSGGRLVEWCHFRAVLMGDMG